MQVNNPYKLGIAALGIIAVTVLMCVGKVDGTAGLAAITGITMYVLGNGVAAVRRDPVQPILAPPERPSSPVYPHLGESTAPSSTAPPPPPSSSAGPLPELD